MKTILRTGVALAARASMNGMVLGLDMPTLVGPGEGGVNIVAWFGYVERGELTVEQLDEKLDLLSMTRPG